ncbi:hypothetical protein XELAEV_18028062mg, partial [Xenopus laevis]
CCTFEKARPPLTAPKLLGHFRSHDQPKCGSAEKPKSRSGKKTRRHENSRSGKETRSHENKPQRAELAGRLSSAQQRSGCSVAVRVTLSGSSTKRLSHTRTREKPQAQTIEIPTDRSAPNEKLQTRSSRRHLELNQGQLCYCYSTAEFTPTPPCFSKLSGLAQTTPPPQE